MLFIPEGLTELQGRGGLVAQLYGQPETAKIETGLMGHHSVVRETQAANPGGLHSLSRGYSCEGATDGGHCPSKWRSSWDQPLTGMSAGVKAYGPTVTRCVAGGGALVRMATTGMGW